MHKITIKTAREIEIMAKGGEMLAKIRDELARIVKPGMTTGKLDILADKLITKAGGKPSFKMVPGYKWATCININDVVVHGIPDGTKIRRGDKIGIDVGMYYLGFHTDTSTTVVANPKSQILNPKLTKFLETGRLALKRAIEQAKPGNRIYDLSEAMQRTVEGAGYSAVRALTGHGIGRELHEEPAIPCFITGQRKHSPEIVPGMILAVEVMYNQGTEEVVYANEDGWTIATADGKISGLFEETVAVTARGPVVLTKSKSNAKPENV